MDFIAYHDDKIINTTRIFSIGGGAIRIKGEDKKKMLLKQIYKDNYATQIIKTCKNNKINLYQYIQRLEDKVL
jgi:hypothetical protein